MRRAASIAVLAALLAVEAGAKTLVIFDTPAKPFSMVDEVAPVAILLTRFDPAPLRKAAAEITTQDITDADRVVLVGVAGVPKLSKEVLAALAGKPLLGIGAAASLAAGASGESKPKAVAGGHVVLGDSEWEARIDPFYASAPAGAEATANVVRDGKAQPLAWSKGDRFGFGALPGAPPLSDIFSDLLVDFYGAPGKPAAMYFLVEDFNPSSGSAALRRLSDYFAHLGVPFAVSTQVRNVPQGTAIEPRDEFLAALRHAQSRGGVVLLRGADSAADIEKFRADGIAPAGFDDAPAAVGLPLHTGRISYKPSPDSEPEPFPASTALLLPDGAKLLPANVRGGADGVALDVVAERIRGIASMRGGVAGVVIPAWLPFQSMRDIADAARSSGVPVAEPLILSQQ